MSCNFFADVLYQVEESPFFLKRNEFTYFWLFWVFIAVRGLSFGCGEWGLLSSGELWASHSVGFSFCAD